MTENEISYQIRGSIFTVYKIFGPGLSESVYVAALYAELSERGLHVRKEVPIPVSYKDKYLDLGFRMDLLVNNKVLIEVKSAENIA